MAAESEDIWFVTLNWKLKDGDIVEKHAKRATFIADCYKFNGVTCFFSLKIWMVSWIIPTFK